MAERREKVIPLRVNDTEHGKFERRAARLNIPVSTYIREAALRDELAASEPPQSVPESTP